MKILMTILAAIGLASGATGYENVSVEEFSKIIKQSDVQILDVRTQEEYAEGHIEGALLANYNGPTFKEDALKVLKKGKKGCYLLPKRAKKCLPRLGSQSAGECSGRICR